MVERRFVGDYVIEYAEGVKPEEVRVEPVPSEPVPSAQVDTQVGTQAPADEQELDTPELGTPELDEDYQATLRAQDNGYQAVLDPEELDKIG